PEPGPSAAPTQPPQVTTAAPSAVPATQPASTPQPAANSRTITPLTTGDEFAFQRVAMFDGLHGWAIVNAGGVSHLLRTEDGGQTWADVSPPTYQAAGDQAQVEIIGAFPAYRQAWVTFFQPDVSAVTHTVWWTDSVGYEWKPGDPLSLPAGGVGFQPLLSAADSSHALYVADVIGADGAHQVTAFHTADGGDTWQTTTLQMCQPTGLALAPDGRAWLTESCLSGSDYSAAVPGLWQSENGGTSWQGIQLDWPDLGMEGPQESSSCRTDDPNLFDGGGAVAVNCFSDTDPGSETEHAIARFDGSWVGYPAPAGQLFFLDARYGWKLAKMIYSTGQGGQNWSLINQVSWQGNFDFIDRWRGWAVTVSEDENALVRTTDGGRSFELMEPALLAPAGSGPTTGCQIMATGSLTAYTRPSRAAQPFGSLSGGMPVYLEARTPDGWYGFNPGVAQAANIGVFHHRWLPPDADITLEGDCEGIPVVEGPLPGVCYEMPMGHVPVYQSADPTAPVL
ncbi:MAG: hypothetical protein WBR18_07915, partial [Anaerolineales bacterium]